MKHFYTYSIILAALIGCKDQQQQGPPANAPVPVTTLKVMELGANYYDEYPGVLVPLNQSEIRAQVTGYITGIHFRDGDKVAKGQKLYSIDQQTYQANYESALANVAVQETNLEKARRDAERYHALDQQDAIAKQQVDYADAALEAAKKQVAAARASAQAVKANVRFATIYAPFSGTIGISQVRNGTSVIAGSTVLNTISTDDPMAADFTVDQAEVYRFSKLQQQKNLVDSTFALVFGSEVYPRYGRLQLIDRAVDPQTGSIKVRLVFPNPQHLLKAGMSASVRVLDLTPSRAVIIPHKAVTEQLGEFFVYLVEQGNKVTQRKVALGRIIGANVVVDSGLSAGDVIVTQGVQNLKEGSAITADTAKAAVRPAAK
ncbi:efflux RND transporter periplasmic adaptor subunit [Niabella terrae]